MGKTIVRILVNVFLAGFLAAALITTFSVDALANDPETDVTLEDEFNADADQSGLVSAAGELSAGADQSDNASSESLTEPAPLEKNSESDTQGRLSADATGAVPSEENALALAWQALSPPYSALTPLPVYGQAMYYNPGVMQRVIDYRLQTARITLCAECVGYAAMLRAGDLNRKIWLQTGKSSFEGPFLVTDVAAPQHVGQLLAKNWAVDVDFRTARSWNMKMPYVTIWDRPPLDLFLERDTLPLVWEATMLPRKGFIWPPRSFETALAANDNYATSQSKPVRKSTAVLLGGGLVEEGLLEYHIR
jgi:hypothetical protein